MEAFWRGKGRRWFWPFLAAFVVLAIGEATAHTAGASGTWVKDSVGPGPAGMAWLDGNVTTSAFDVAFSGCTGNGADHNGFPASPTYAGWVHRFVDSANAPTTVFGSSLEGAQDLTATSLCASGSWRAHQSAAVTIPAGSAGVEWKVCVGLDVANGGSVNYSTCSGERMSTIAAATPAPTVTVTVTQTVPGPTQTVMDNSAPMAWTDADRARIDSAHADLVHFGGIVAFVLGTGLMFILPGRKS